MTPEIRNQVIQMCKTENSNVKKGSREKTRSTAVRNTWPVEEGHL